MCSRPTRSAGRSTSSEPATAVTANLSGVALAGGATATEAMELAMAAASLVIHQLGTTGTASVRQMADLLGFASVR